MSYYDGLLGLEEAIQAFSEYSSLQQEQMKRTQMQLAEAISNAFVKYNSKTDDIEKTIKT